MLICDEPTASLDAKSGSNVMELLADLAIEGDRSVIIVTHDDRIFNHADAIHHMADGEIEEVEDRREEADERREERKRGHESADRGSRNGKRRHGPRILRGRRRRDEQSKPWPEDPES